MVSYPVDIAIITLIFDNVATEKKTSAPSVP